MLKDLLSAHRENLIQRCGLKVSQRPAPQAAPTQMHYGIPVVIDQMLAALKGEKRGEDIGAERTAALHGDELFRLGYTVDQVVHAYGDLCQAITELADEIDAAVTVQDFHTLNRVLDNSIAHAVSAYVRQHDAVTTGEGAQAVHDRLGALADEQRVLLDAALDAVVALKADGVGAVAVLERSLLGLRDLVDRSLPQIRIASGMITPSNP